MLALRCVAFFFFLKHVALRSARSLAPEKSDMDRCMELASINWIGQSRYQDAWPPNDRIALLVYVHAAISRCIHACIQGMLYYSNTYVRVLHASPIYIVSGYIHIRISNSGRRE
jgi:hypothetical protein